MHMQWLSANIVLVVAPTAQGTPSTPPSCRNQYGSIMSQSFGSGGILIQGNKVQMAQAHKTPGARRWNYRTCVSWGFGAANAFMVGLKLIIGAQANASSPPLIPWSRRSGH
jgi:hypothetical protein